MNLRRLMVHVLLIGLVASLSACQSAFPRACLTSADCEHHPVNGPSVLDPVRGPLVLGGEKSVR